MANRYTNAILTVIALLLAAVVAKLYVPATQSIGPRLAGPTRGDFIEAQEIDDRKAKSEKLGELRSQLPMAWVIGDIDVSGSTIDVSGSTVEVEGTVKVRGEVVIEDRVY